MKRVILLLVLLCIASCGSNYKYKYRNWLEYNFPIKDENFLKEKIKKVERLSPSVFIMFGMEEEKYFIHIIPSNNLEKETITKFKILNSYRYIRIDENYYPLVFFSDQQFGGIRKKEILPTGKEVIGYLKKWKIYEQALTLYFDKDWNFIESKSLINY